MQSSSRYLSVAAGHVDALISYVNDIKPYHSKLRQVVEEYVFEDLLNVKFTDRHKIVAFLGADILDPINYAGSGRKTATSWRTERISDGARTKFALPLVSHPKFLSHVNQDKFICGEDDDHQIDGLHIGAFSQRRWDGPGITSITKNGELLHEGIDFDISHGVFSFATRGSSRWKQLDINHRSEFAPNPGILRYNDVHKPFGTITNIVSDANQLTYDEWTLECIYTDNTTITLSVTGKFFGNIGTASFNVPFTSPYISFLFTTAIIDPPGTLPKIFVGDKFVLTPVEKITVHPNAPEETWSLIKVNPRRLANLNFTAGEPIPTGSPAPNIQVYARDLHIAPPSLWEIEFISATEFQLNAVDPNSAISLDGYPKTINIIDGCSYKDELIHFTLFPVPRGFKAGDKFSFEITPGVPTFRVFGSISGWQQDAVIGEWYWNGKIGFKIPPLDYFSLVFTPSIATSSDGVIWTTVLASGQELSQVEYVDNGSNSGFLITGEQSIVASSISGQNWQNDITALASDGQRSIVIGENGFIAMTSLVEQPSSGPPVFEWYARNSHTTNDLNSITFVPDFFINPPPQTYGLFVVTGNNGTIITSANGHAWAVQNSGTTEHLNSIAWKKLTSTSLIMVAVGNNGTILTSGDALTWTPVVSGTPLNLNRVEYIEELGIFIAIGEAGTIIRSSDGINWTSISSALTTNLLKDLAYMPISPGYPAGKIVIIADNGVVLTSTNAGNSWDSSNTPPFNAIAWGNGQFVAVGSGTRNSDQVISVGEVHPMAEPCVYEITFMDEDADFKYAKVSCNIGGTKRGIKIDKSTDESPVWTDGFVTFKIVDNPTAFTIGDKIRIYIAPANYYNILKFYNRFGYDLSPYDLLEYDLAPYVSAPYDQLPYDTSLYDQLEYNLVPYTAGPYDEFPYDLVPYDSLFDENGEIKIPLAYLFEYFPLFHSHGTVIIKNCAVGDKISIDKALFDAVRLKLHNTSILSAPRLAPDENDWIPLEFRYGDRATNGSIVSTAEFSDLATVIDAYAAADPDFKIFTLTQPKYECSNKSSYCLLEFTSEFLAEYLPLGTKFTIMAMPQESYSQLIRVKVTENLRIYSRVNLIFEDIAYINVSDAMPGLWESASQLNYNDIINVAIAEGGIIPLLSYDTFLYDLLPYDTPYPVGPVPGVQEFPLSYESLPYDSLPYDTPYLPMPGSGNYVFTGNPLDVVTLGKIIGTPPITSGYNGAPGILILEKTGGGVPNPVGYDTNQYDEISYESSQYSQNSGPIESAGASFTEGLKIVDSSGANTRVHIMYDVAKYTEQIVPPTPIDGLLIEDTADEYIVTHNYMAGTPFLIVEPIATPGTYLNPIPDTTPYNGAPGATSSWSFSFTVPPGTAPFRLRLV